MAALRGALRAATRARCGPGERRATKNERTPTNHGSWLRVADRRAFGHPGHAVIIADEMKDLASIGGAHCTNMTAPRVSVASIRAWHAAISAFVAPMVLFFAISGIFQIFDLHDAHGTYVPSPILSAMGQLHKNQVLAPEHPRPPHPGPKEPEPPEPPTPPATAALKYLFALEALGLVFTTLIGVWIGVTHPKYARRTWVLLGLGIVLPALLLIA
jgi:hypothetical protein